MYIREKNITMKKLSFIISTIFILLNTVLFAQEIKEDYREISGKVTYLKKAILNVNVIILNGEDGIETGETGKYSINAKTGDVIQFSHIRYQTIEIIVEDITGILNIEMTEIINQLDEAVVKGKKKNPFPDKDRTEDRKKFSTSKGAMDPETAGHSIGFIDGDEVNFGYRSLSEALLGKVPGLIVSKQNFDGTYVLKIRGNSSHYNNRPPIWDVDGVIYEDEPRFLPLHDIKNIHVLKSLIATNKYGSLGAHGVIVIQTKDAYNMSKTNIIKEDISKKYTNKNFYKNDAIAFTENKISTNSISLSTLKNLAASNHSNPEILKAIAYQMQAMGEKNESINLYEKIFILRPKYAQSYRDLAIAYSDNNNYKRAWRMYISYMLQGENVSDLAIGDLIYSEMEWMYYNRKNQAGIKESFIPKSASLTDFKGDVRLVVEWNTSEAEFVLEFVNPDKQVYSFNHTLTANEQLIIDEKEIGFSSKEFFIDDLGNGDWLVNINYLGNKKPEPTHFKITVYSNWGSPNQTQEVSVFKFENERNKIQLYKFKNNSVVFNGYVLK